MSNTSSVVVVSDCEQLDTFPEPGQILLYDFRDQHPSAVETCACQNKHGPAPLLKLVQWNIERAYKLDEVIRILLSHDADIVCLQELDIGCERSDRRNSAFEIARALRMKCAFAVEFEEVRSSLRSQKSQGGGVHGNAILSRFDLDPRIVPHSHHPVDWTSCGHLFREPRRGERIVLAASVHVPGLSLPLLAYSLHLEVFCGIFSRVMQFADVLADSRGHIDTNPHQIIFGDLNTMAHGIARFSPTYCGDRLRWLSLGYSEAQWWQRHIFDVVDGSAAGALANPHFFDPFCLTKDTTLQGYFGLFRGKLDWTLLRGLSVLAKGMDNHDYHASDHKLLYVVVRPVIPAHPDDDVGRRAWDLGYTFRNHRRDLLASIAWTIGFSVALIGSGYYIVSRYCFQN